jgi:murein DD-endopeptidase MepM/ murein hydrolase activator NlpD
MAFKTTRVKRASHWRTIRVLATTTIAISFVQIVAATSPMAQVKAPSKQQFRSAKVAPPKADPADSHADELNAQWLSEHSQGVPKQAVPSEDERVSAIPSQVPPATAGARALVNGSLKLVKADSTAAALKSLPEGANLPTLKEVADAFAGFAPNGSRAKVELIQGRTADGWARPLYASIGDSKTKQSYWWFAPPDQPEGWFDEQGKRLGGTALAEPKPGSRISSPFGRRTYYGRVTSSAFHNGIDFEGKTGDPILAAADGVINHEGWYFNYGRTVKISHADNFETLYAHMSAFATGLAPGSRVKKGDLIGYVGSTGRSTGPHLHFSAIVNGQFVDPAHYLSETGNGQLNGEALVAFRQWQQQIRTAVVGKKADSDRPIGKVYGGEYWTQNPFSAGAADHRL